MGITNSSSVLSAQPTGPALLFLRKDFFESASSKTILFSGFCNLTISIHALPFCHWSLKTERPLPAAYPQEIKSLGDHIRKRRLNLGLLQKDVAKRIGVSKDTIHNWETDRTEPEVKMVPNIINFLGYVPYDSNWSFGQWLRAVRAALGLSQEQLARRAGLDESTLAKWERQGHKPTKKKWISITTVFDVTINDFMV